MSLHTSSLKVNAGLVAWAAAVWSTLSLSRLTGDWGHGICGTWGCGPPIQVLLAWHLTWLVILLPACWLIRSKLTTRSATRIGLVGIAVAVLGLIAIVTYEAATWLPLASDWQKRFFLHRIAFVTACCVEFPVWELLVSGWLLSTFKVKSNPAPQTGHGIDF